MEPEPKKNTLLLKVSLFVAAAFVIGWLVLDNQKKESQINAYKSEINTYQVSDEKKQALAAEDQGERQRLEAELEQKHKDYRNNWPTYIKAKPSEFSYREIGGIYGLNVVVGNNTDEKIEEVSVDVHYIKENGNVFKTEQVIVYNIEPHSQKTASAPDSNRGTSVKMDITNIKAPAFHFCYPGDAVSRDEADPWVCY